MHLIKTKTLTSNQYHDAATLINLCKANDSTRGISFLEPEMNAIPEFPCFYLLYNGTTLVSLLSVFLPDDTQCEVYASTIPSERMNGYFGKLLSSAVNNLSNYGIKKIYIVNEPACTSGTNFLNSSPNVKFAYSEYLMKYNMDITPIPKEILSIKVKKNENTEEISSFFENEEIGHLCIEHNRGVATIYGFVVEPNQRGKGFGTETLLLVLRHLIKSGCHKILLQVNGANTAAHNMYSHHGFVSEEQIDYWQYTN